MSGPRVVAFGGGHGLAASLAALRTVTDRLTAVVTVADDGGSSGRIRAELPVLPPGDLRMALVALSAADSGAALWSEALAYRFPGAGPLGGHAAGNLLLAALQEVTADPVAALAAAGRLLGLAGGTRVLPMACCPLDIVATVDGPGRRPAREIRGQHQVATTTARVRSVRLEPAAPRPCPQALAAVAEADAVVLGPGSLFTSVLPHLLLAELRKAVQESGALRILVQNLAPQPGETAGFSPERHLRALRAAVPDLLLDVVVADPGTVPDPTALARAAGDLGARLRLTAVARAGRTGEHDPALLAAVLRTELSGAKGARNR